MLYNAMLAPLADLFYQPATSDDWKVYEEISETRNTIDSEKRLLKIYKELSFLIALGNASYAGKTKGKNLITQGIYTGAYASFFLVFSKQC